MSDITDCVRAALVAARSAQRDWAARPLTARLGILRTVRHLIAAHALQLAGASAGCRERPAVESLTAEVLPLADACRFLERDAAALLAPRRPPRRTLPLWLNGVGTEVRREPFGVVLIIGPGNYPLLLPGVQLVQALAAGNAVLLKPGVGSTAPGRMWIDLLVRAGVPPALVPLLPESVEATQAALSAGVDKVVFTGSAATGERILAQLAPQLVPATMELSGCDVVFVRDDADLDLTVRSLVFGLKLNAGATCLGPRRLFVAGSLATELESRLARTFAGDASWVLAPAVSARVRPAVTEALAGGAHLIRGELRGDGSVLAPLIVGGASPSSTVMREDLFAPVLAIATVRDDAEALEEADACPYALGATIFSRDEQAARSLAGRIRAGGVVINDMIAPTVDPRAPFGGRGRSGYGVTRGAEGLLEMTTLKVITWNRARWRPHLDEALMSDAGFFESFLEFSHGRGFRFRGRALVRLLKAAARRARAARGRAPREA